MSEAPRLRWDKLEPQLLMACLLPTASETARAVEAIASRHRISRRTMYRRMKFIGATRVEARMGPKAVTLWERQVRQLARTYPSHLRLMATISGRAAQLRREVREELERTYTDHGVARSLFVSVALVRFFADTLCKLRRNEQGLFTGAELQRFVTEESYLLKAERVVSRAVARKATP